MKSCSNGWAANRVRQTKAYVLAPCFLRWRAWFAPSLSGQVRKGPDRLFCAHVAPTLGGVENVLGDIERGAHASDAATSRTDCPLKLNGVSISSGTSR